MPPVSRTLPLLISPRLRAYGRPSPLSRMARLGHASPMNFLQIMPIRKHARLIVRCLFFFAARRGARMKFGVFLPLLNAAIAGPGMRIMRVSQKSAQRANRRSSLFAKRVAAVILPSRLTSAMMIIDGAAKFTVKNANMPNR